ncbi:MAG: HEAT repeat domain-containing protein, partial [Gemmataceae bacterium]
MRTAMRFLLPALSVCALTAALPAQPSKPATKPTSTPSAPSMADSKWPAQIAGKSLKEWMDKLDDPDPSTRDAAIRVLPSFGPAAEKAIPKLLSKMTGDFDATVRCSAMIAVTANGLDDKAQLPKVIDGVAAVMKTNQASVRIQAAYAASRIGKPARDHLTGSLIDLLHDQQSYEVRRAAAVAIGNVCYDEKDQPDQRALTAL